MFESGDYWRREGKTDPLFVQGYGVPDVISRGGIAEKAIGRSSLSWPLIWNLIGGSKSVLVTGASSGSRMGGCGSPGALSRQLLPSQPPRRQDERAGRPAEETAAAHSGSGRAMGEAPAEVFSAVNDFVRQRGGLDVAWVNSGHGADASFAKWDWDRIESVLDTNLKGAIYTIRACLEVMVPRKKGAIVGIGSAMAMRGMPAAGVYGLSKIGLDYFMESLAVELPEIQFTMIHPGFVDTEINKGNPHQIWVLAPEKAAKIMIRAVERRKRILIYPRRVKILYRAVRMLPAPVYTFLARKIVKRFRD